MEIGVFNTLMILLAIALVIIVTFRTLHIPALIGYIFIGIIVGPHAFKWLPNNTLIKEVAEFGVVFLLFTIGLEFSVNKLMHLKRIVFGFGGLQVLISSLLTMLVAWALKMTFAESIVIAGIVALSSTAIVSKQLTEQLELSAPHGRNAIGILLFQDLAMIPFLIIIPSLGNGGTDAVLFDLAWALGKSLLAILLIIAMGRWFLRPLFHKIAETKSTELFTLATLFVAIGSAWLTHILGLSMALGAFLAGMMLAETEFNHQLSLEMRPFRDILLGLFFISIGMQFNIVDMLQYWKWISLLFSALIIGKTLLIILLGCYFTNNKNTAIRTGLVLGQGSEFGFAILFSATRFHIFPGDYAQATIAALLLSMALSPLLIKFNGKIANIFVRKKQNLENDDIQQTNEHVILCGFGRVGETVSKILNKHNVDFVAIEQDPKMVKVARQKDMPVVFGNIHQTEMLKKAGIEHAKAILISYVDKQQVTRFINTIKKLNPDIMIVARCYDEEQADKLIELGVNYATPEVMQTSLLLATQLLVSMGAPAENVLETHEDLNS